MLLRKRHLLIAVACCALLQLASVRTRRITPAIGNVTVSAEGSFQRDGHYPGEPFAGAVGVRAWGSWSGSDQNLGTLVLGPFAAPRVLRFGIGGYPDNPGNALRVELAGTPQCVELHPGAIGERWRIIDYEVPADWVGRPVRIVAEDYAKALGGWLAVTEPIRGGRSDGNHALIQSLAAWAINGVALGLLFFAALEGIARRGGLATPWAPLAAAAIVAAAGYFAFWCYFVHAFAGVIISWLMLAVAGWRTLRRSGNDHWSGSGPASHGADAKLRAEVAPIVGLLVIVGAFYLGLLHVFPTQHDFYTLAANRYREALPSDNMLSHVTAERLFASQSLKGTGEEWLSSDRPPLQAGWQLLTWPLSKLLALDRRTASGTSAFWLQLLWIPAAWGLLRTFAVPRARTAGWIAAMALAGFFVQNTTFTWPKLSAAAFACGAFAALFFSGVSTSARAGAAWSALFAGLAWLSHGGVAFAFLALLPLLAWRARGGRWRAWRTGTVIVAGLLLPWLAYQKFYDPPGNRLLKWHLAGQSEIDARGTWETLRESYARIGWREAWANKVSNFHGQVLGDWGQLLDLRAATAAERRNQEFFHTGRALTWWPIGALLAVVLTRRRWTSPAHELALFGGWILATVLVWCLLMFGRYQAAIHHGSYTVMIGLFVVCCVVMERAGRAWLPVIASAQAITLGTTWAVASGAIGGPAAGTWFVIGAGVLLAAIIVRVARSEPVTEPAPQERPATLIERPLAALRTWWANPTLNLWILAALAGLLALRKPHALHTPQLWAEDGSIFLMQADLHGNSALAMPYMGYLHTLPRMIAWLAPRFFDPAWWPACYNVSAFAIWLAVLARLFSPRLALPGKPWLALALILVPHTGEVFFNITNLQWLTAFVLIQQVLIAAPRTMAERVSDLLILAVVTLTGPFGIAFLPLFVWRAWRDRQRDSLLALAVVAVCAAVQLWFVIRTGPKFAFQTEPLRIWPNLVVLARRLIFWPLLGRAPALALPAGFVGVVGTLAMAALALWTLRPDSRRAFRFPVLAAFGLIVAAAVYRTRPDTWAADNLDYGDRYFYIPRVLLGWLLIWEFHAVPRAVANAAKLVGVVVVCVHLRDFSVPAPIDYRWSTHVEPIRRGVPADIPTLPEGWTLEYRGRPAASR